MMTRIPFVLVAAALTLTILHQSKAEPEVRTREIRQPEIAIYRFGQLYPEKPSETRHFVFIEGRSGFSLASPSGDLIAKNVHYVKTFGGTPSTIEIQLIRDRFIVYPETLKDSVVPDSLFHEMHAITHVYDLKLGKLVGSSEKYRYDHDIPLRYDFGKILMWERRDDKSKQSD